MREVLPLMHKYASMYHSSNKGQTAAQLELVSDSYSEGKEINVLTSLSYMQVSFLRT